MTLCIKQIDPQIKTLPDHPIFVQHWNATPSQVYICLSIVVFVSVEPASLLIPHIILFTELSLSGLQCKYLRHIIIIPTKRS